MNTESIKNKTAWEYCAYEFWYNQGAPKELFEKMLNDPSARLRYR